MYHTISHQSCFGHQDFVLFVVHGKISGVCLRGFQISQSLPALSSPLPLKKTVYDCSSQVLPPEYFPMAKSYPKGGNMHFISIYLSNHARKTSNMIVSNVEELKIQLLLDIFQLRLPSPPVTLDLCQFNGKQFSSQSLYQAIDATVSYSPLLNVKKSVVMQLILVCIVPF